MKKAVLFVHGLGGGKSTWGDFENLIKTDDDLKNYTPFFYVYPSCLCRILPFFQKNYTVIQRLSKGLKTYIDNKLNDYKEIVLVGHSLGGIVIKQYLMDQKISSTHTKIKKVFFYAVPHEGSNSAQIGCFISMAFSYYHLHQLCKKSDFLDLLNGQWKSSNIAKNYEFRVVVAEEDEVVSSQSAQGNFNSLEIEYIAGVGHIDVVKPNNKDDLSFIILKTFILKSLKITKNHPNAFKTYEEWVRQDTKEVFFPDPHRKEILQTIKDNIVTPQHSIRLIGLSGLGKTRVALEALKELNDAEKSSILYIDIALEPSGIITHVNNWVSEGYGGILVVDNCSVAFHDQLLKIVSRPECQISLLTIDSDMEQSGNCSVLRLERLENEMIKKILTHKFAALLPDIDRIVAFAQGFPQMAVLLAQARISEDPNLGKLTDDLITKKLLWGTSNPNDIDEKILMGCSLFDHFRLAEDASCEFKFIAEKIVDVNHKDFYACVARFSERGIIDRRGRYAQLVPKPLAIRLASQWWNRNPQESQRELIKNIPDSMIPNFCEQIKKLDFLPDVKKFTSELCGVSGPFGQAEVILSIRGSRLFRAFVELNPEATSAALYRVITNLKNDQLKEITGDIRRNLVASLERLCFHAHLFEESAWSLFLLAMTENEGWNNNATGIFSQLFHVYLSGTAANPERRFSLIKKALDLNNEQADIIILNALQKAIDSHGTFRMVGAEYQGMSAPLQEWKPKIWGEIFDYWQAAMDILLIILNRGPIQKEKAMNIIGFQIRAFVHNGRIEMVDKVIREVVKKNGPYWPAALESIKNAIEYDAKDLKQENIDILNGWLELLSPEKASIEEKLKILVINPPWEHCKDENGNHIDKAAEKANELASEISTDLSVLNNYIPILLTGEQKQVYAFGQQLIIEAKDYSDFLSTVLVTLKDIESPNIIFLKGLLDGVFQKSEYDWQNYIEKISQDKILVRYYPEVIKTGKIKENHLEKAIELVKQGLLFPESLNTLAYGSVTDDVPPSIITKFSLNLSELGNNAIWTSLNIMYMYCFRDDDKFNTTRKTLEILVSSVPLRKYQEIVCSDMYHWSELARKLLESGGKDFALAICKQLLKESDEAFEYRQLEENIKPLFIDIMKMHGEGLWPLFSDAIISANDRQISCLRQLFSKGLSFSEERLSVFSILPSNLIIKWCHENKKIGPEFVSDCIDIFVMKNGHKCPSDLFIALLEEFGDDKHVTITLSASIDSRCWEGSLVPYLKSDKEALMQLINHSNNNVRTWVKKHISLIDKNIDSESIRDEEERIGIY